MPIHTSWKSNYDDVLSDLYLNFEVPAKQLEPLFGVCSKTLRKQLRRLNIIRSNSEIKRLNWNHGQKFNREKSGFKKGEGHILWKGGRCYDSKGYILIFDPNNPFSEKHGYILEHRLVWFSHHPETPKDWIIHHLNGIRDDNQIENLIACPRRKHLSQYPNTYIEALRTRIRELEGCE